LTLTYGKGLRAIVPVLAVTSDNSNRVDQNILAEIVFGLAGKTLYAKHFEVELRGF